MTSNLTQRLIDGLSLIPNAWQIVPTNGNKQPLGNGWQLYPFNKDELIQQLLLTGGVMVRNRLGDSARVYPKGVGVLTGSELVAVDVDGSSARAALCVLAKGQKLPRTVAFTSGRPGRCQYLFSIPKSAAVRSRRIKSGIPGEALEIRGAGMMSILPPSMHPVTGQYRWMPACCPSECAIATAPEWLMGLMQRGAIEGSTPKLHHSSPGSTCSNKQIATLLANLAPARANDYHEWIRIGMALYSHSPTLLPLWDEWSRQSSKYKPGECDRKWSTFNPKKISIGTLFYLAQTDSSSKR